MLFGISNRHCILVMKMGEEARFLKRRSKETLLCVVVLSLLLFVYLFETVPLRLWFLWFWEWDAFRITITLLCLHLSFWWVAFKNLQDPWRLHPWAGPFLLNCLSVLYGKHRCPCLNGTVVERQVQLKWNIFPGNLFKSQCDHEHFGTELGQKGGS